VSNCFECTFFFFCSSTRVPVVLINAPNVRIVLTKMQTDDVGVFGSNLSNEYALIAEHFGLNKEEICALARSAIDTIFGSKEDKQRLRELMWK